MSTTRRRRTSTRSTRSASAADDPTHPGGRAYFVSNGEPVVLWSWINALLEDLSIQPVVRRVPASVAYGAGALCEGVWRLMGARKEPPISRFVARQLATSHWYDMEPARRDLGYAPGVSMEEGKQRLLASMETQA